MHVPPMAIMKKNQFSQFRQLYPKEILIETKTGHILMVR